jgi:D-glycero-D-manno-heptose 1,7-bisphosphate phosphatase
MAPHRKPRDLPLLLLDRDGTLIEDQEYLKDPKKVILCRGAIAGLTRLSRAGFPMVIISNQSGVGRHLMTVRDVNRVNARLLAILAKRRIRLSGVYVCIHRPDRNCACRKPKLKLARQAARELRRPLRGSISIGDKWSDVLLGQRTGGKGVLVLTGVGRKNLANNPAGIRADYVAKNFDAAARWLIRAQRKEINR